MEIWDGNRDTYGGLYVQQYGWEVCDPGHQFGPAVRDHYLVHFVASGRGTYWVREQSYTVRAGQGFIIFPGQLTTYRADTCEPWVYGWVGYAGIDAEPLTTQVGLTREAPVFTCHDPKRLWALLSSMPKDDSALRLGSLAVLGTLYQMLALLGQGVPAAAPDINQETYRRALWYMQGNYDRPIHIGDVADFVGLSRSQLFRVFQKVAGTSPKESLGAIRMQRARMLLRDTSLTTDAIAASVGVASSARLGVLFRKAHGVTLSQYRRQRKEREPAQDDML